MSCSEIKSKTLLILCEKRIKLKPFWQWSLVHEIFNFSSKAHTSLQKRVWFSVLPKKHPGLPTHHPGLLQSRTLNLTIYVVRKVLHHNLESEVFKFHTGSWGEGGELTMSPNQSGTELASALANTATSLLNPGFKSCSNFRVFGRIKTRDYQPQSRKVFGPFPHHGLRRF